MQKIDLLSRKEIYMNGAVYKPMHGGLSYDGGEGPNLTVTYEFVRKLDLKPSKFPLISKKIEKNVEYRLARLEARLDRFIDRYFEETCDGI